MLLEASHDSGLIILSLIISVWGVYSSLGVMGNVFALQGGARMRALLSAAVLMGVSIWTVHFVGVLSHTLPTLTVYLPSYVFLSLLVTLFVSVVATYLMVLQRGPRVLLLAGAVLGGAIAVMYLTGVMALKVSGLIEYKMSVILISLAIALAASITGLYLMSQHIHLVRQGKGEKNRHLQASLVLGLGIAVAHYTALSGTTVTVTGGAHLIDSLDGVITRSELTLWVVFVVGTTIAIISFLLRNIKFNAMTLGVGVNYWLVGIGVFGISLMVLGQWFVANSFQKESSLAQVGYRIQSDLAQMRYMQEVANGEPYRLANWLERVDDIAHSIDVVMNLDGVVTTKEDEQLRKELWAISTLVARLSTTFSAEAKGEPASFVKGVETEKTLSALHLLSEDLLANSLLMAQHNQRLLSFINGANTIWFLLVFGSVIAVMRRREQQLSWVNTEMKEALHELQRQKYAIDQHAIVAMTDPSGAITYVNDKFCQISQYSEEELLGANHQILNSGLHSQTFWQDMWQTIGAGKVWQGDIRNRNKSGEYYWVNTTIVPFMGSNNLPERYLSMRTDISRSKQAEMELREKEYWMNSLIQALPDEALLQDVDTRWLIANDILLRNLGLSGDEYQGLTTKQLVEKSDILKQRVLIDGEGEQVWERDDITHWELEYPTSQGNAVFEVVNVPLFNEDGSRKGGVRVASDISARKRVEEENQMLASAIFQAEEGMFIADAQGQLEYVNPAYEETLSSEGDIIGTQLPLLNSECSGSEFSEMLWDALTRGESWSGRYEWHCSKDKNERNFMVSLSPVVTVKGMRFVGLLRDVTDEQNLENQLQQAQKMESIGRLAGGIAHDFNNILTAIIGYSDLVQDDLPVGSDAYSNMLEIRTASQRAKELVKQILSFSRQSYNERQIFDAETVVKEAVRLIRTSSPATITIEEQYAGISMMVEMDPTQLHQIIMNLCVNAMQAMDEKGRLVIATRQCSASELDISELRAGELGCYLHLSVADNGPGVPEKLHSKIFEPFFTTKEVGSGTGMGLAAVHGIVNNNQGVIRLRDSSESGACFDIYLPLASHQQPEKLVAPAPAPAPATKSKAKRTVHAGTVLYVDDEVALTNVIQLFLTSQGFDVDVVNDPLDALKMIVAAPEKYDVVVSDQLMPNMRGDQLVEEVLNISPGMPFVLCSGYSDSVNLERAKEKGVREVLQKPVDFRSFSELLKGIVINRRSEA